MPIRHRSDFKQALSTFRQLKDREDEAQRNQRWTQSCSSSWWNWQGTWWNSSYDLSETEIEEKNSNTGKFFTVWLRRKRQ